MDRYAEMGCILKVNVHCDGCKMKMMQVLNAISGVYSVTIDAQEGTARVAGEVDPNVLLRALARSGKHAEIVRVNLKHPVLKRSYYGDDYSPYGHDYSHGYGGRCYDAIDDDPYYCYSNRHGTSQLPDIPRTWYDTRPRNYPYSWGGDYPARYNYGRYSYDSPLPPALYVPSTPAPAYDPHMDDAHISLCSIM
ncbi:hypothetical protein RJ639_035008 [Escallonia herrerae]|uniref:HMA domain-containing protein n=1 Tax=Escallonia herrerae TaxID=1293975 RepID=A0AA88WW64_9ASTE|nr:hypothetical protein RJ639_035008 [Escallonia herrerae]